MECPCTTLVFSSFRNFCTFTHYTSHIGKKLACVPLVLPCIISNIRDNVNVFCTISVEDG